MSSFDETVSSIFDDSGLSIILDSDLKSSSYPSEFIDLSGRLRSLVKSIPANISPKKIIEDSKMQQIRAISKDLLKVAMSVRGTPLFREL